MFEMFHHFTGSIIVLYILTSSCILISKRDNVLSFISIYF